MKHIFFGVILFIGGILGWASIKMGFFKDVVILEQDRGEIQCVYLEHIGPYHKILDSLEKVEAWAKASSVDCRTSFGHFIDDPDVIEHERLRAHVGCVVDKVYADLPVDFKYKSIPAAKYLVAEFSGSPALGPMRVYSKAKRAFYDRKLVPAEDVIEVYERIDDKNMKTSYLFHAEPTKN